MEVKNKEMNGYNLTRKWFDFKFDNPGVARSSHTELYFYIVDLWNRLGQKEKFGLPTAVTMECLGIGSYNTYKKTLNDLIEFGFVILIQESLNQYKSKIIAISNNDKATDKATDKPLDKAHIKATDDIDKQYNKEQINNINNINKSNLDFHQILKFESVEWLESVSMKHKMTIEDIQKYIDEFELFLKTKQTIHKNKNEYVNHFINWLSKKNEFEKEKKLREKKETQNLINGPNFNQNNKQPFRFDFEELSKYTETKTS